MYMQTKADRRQHLYSPSYWLPQAWSLLMAVASLTAWIGPVVAKDSAETPRKPNVVFILADDLGYGDLGCYGQREIRTPNLDRLAADGIRFTDVYAGSCVCAPSRCTLMTGLHTGHCRIRGNASVPLLPQDVTVPKLLKQAGYATALVGKWGLGEADSTGAPNRQGFDEFFGYLNQVHAHNYYPDFLWHNEAKVSLDNVVAKGVASRRGQYSPDLFIERALGFIDRHQREPFFLYFASTLPHANNEAGKAGMEIPSDAPYGDRDWPQAQKNHAAMISRLDGDVGRLLKKLADLGLAENTLVMFSSDNGPHREGGAAPNFFHSSGRLRGIKRDLYEGGVRTPMIVRWTGKIAAGQTSRQVWAFWDLLPTLADMAGVAPPANIDGISVWPTLVGQAAAGHEQAAHDPLYWEFYEKGFLQAVRKGPWKAIRIQSNSMDKPAQTELYNLDDNPGEGHDTAREQPKIMAELTAIMKADHVPSENWPTPDEQAAAKGQAKTAK